MKASAALIARWEQVVAAAPAAPILTEAQTGEVHARRGLAEAARQEAAGLPPRLERRRVVLVAPNGEGWLRRLLALWHVDAIPVPLDPSEPLPRQREVAERLRAAAVWNEHGWHPCPAAPAARDNATLIKLTSGSTGQPQPLRFTAAQLLADSRQVCASMGIGPSDRNLVVIPLGHSYGLGNIVLPLLDQGTAAVVARAPLPRVLAEDCLAWQPTVFPAVPPVLKLLAEADLSPQLLGSLRTVISAGSPLPAAVAQAFHARFGLKVHGFYGSSETGGITFDRTGDATLAGRSVGTALEGVTLQHLRSGRVRVTSAAVFTLGNRRRPVGERGQHVPADRALPLAGNEWQLAGRTGRMVKIAGRRLDLTELEALLRRTDGISDAYATAHPERPEQLAAALETTLNEREVRSRLASHLPAWKIPRRLVLYPRFPVTSRGKRDTTALRQRLGLAS